MGLRQSLTSWAADLLDLIFPRRCEVCGTALVRTEQVMCLQCLADMPLCTIHTDPFNDMHRRLIGHAPVNRAGALFHYHRTQPHTRLIHAAKYASRPSVARHLGAMMARRFAPDGFFDSVDCIMPVPLHPLRQLRRGYNQSLHIALGIASVTGIAVDSRSLRTTRTHATQTRLSAYARWLNTRNSFTISPKPGPAPRHILLVDDVITTGATLLACAEEVHRTYPDADISVCTLAITGLQ